MQQITSLRFFPWGQIIAVLREREPDPGEGITHMLVGIAVPSAALRDVLWHLNRLLSQAANYIKLHTGWHWELSVPGATTLKVSQSLHCIYVYEGKCGFLNSSLCKIWNEWFTCSSVQCGRITTERDVQLQKMLKYWAVLCVPYFLLQERDHMTPKYHRAKNHSWYILKSHDTT